MSTATLDSNPKGASGAIDGLRERKKRETLRRIAETGLRLFVTKGYEATTLDEIAADSGIARRTFFYYFRSKEAILLAYMDGGFAKAIGPAMHSQPTGKTPFHTMQDAILELMSQHGGDDGIKVMKLLTSTDTLRARIQASFFEMEQASYEALCQLWPDPSMRTSLRVVAMAAMGAMRVAKENWLHDDGERPLHEYLTESFAVLEREI